MTLAWYDPTNQHVSTNKNDPLFTPLGQLWPLDVKREWVGLTDEELLNAYGWYEMVEKNRFWEDTHPMLEKARQDILVGLRNIENKLKEKNNA